MTAQKVHILEHTSPKIKNVAVFCEKH
ncbi:hypothetical protein PITCH_A140030 [uncultured Desulfobacterium sp.]|uniref:Uncharacterized protein n=1 Tax=uncultured Desulfobacterium sp. TaxID=201089 RepID=A0A445MSV2_9BACT|nr:hypothetical protein PITCH_A140030 [uncultured Desulfobacterium sp.]